MSGIGHLRTSDADRDQVAEQLRTAATEGRIATDELDERLGAALAARTYAELEALVADLPGTRPARRLPTVPSHPVARVAIGLAIALPMMMAAIFVLTSLFTVWILWAILGWCLVGHRHHRYGARLRHYHYGGHRHHDHYGGSHHAHRQAGAGPGRGSWV